MNSKNDDRSIGIYIRVSTLEQVKEGYSISAQRERLTAYCVAQGWDNYKFYVDEGVSAKDTRRAQLELLFEHIEQGKISTILVYRLDRFTRSVSDLYNMLKRMEEYDCAFRSATEMYDTATAMGRMFIGLVALMAQWETDNLSERIIMGLDEKVSKGERVGGIPYGFNLNDDEKLEKNEESLVVREMIDKIMSGSSANSVSDYLTETNSDKPKWHTSSILRLMRNPALYGSTSWKDKIYEDTHEGIIDKKEWLKLQDVLSERTTHPRRRVKDIYIFQQKIKCTKCGKILSSNRYFKKKVDGSEIVRVQYRCQLCRKNGLKSKSVTEKLLLESLLEYMRALDLDNLNVNITPVKKPRYVEQLSEIERKREKYQRGWAADLIGEDEFKKLMSETRDTYEDLKEKVKNHKDLTPVNINALKGVLFSFNQSFSALTKEEKKMFVAMYIKHIEFKQIPQPPKSTKSKAGMDLVIVTKVEFY